MPVPIELCGLTASVEELVTTFEELRMVAMRGNLLTFPGAAELIAFGQSIGLPLALATSGGREYVDEVDYLRVYIRRLRRKLEPDPERPRHILTERGLGYRFLAP